MKDWANFTSPNNIVEVSFLDGFCRRVAGGGIYFGTLDSQGELFLSAIYLFLIISIGARLLFSVFLSRVSRGGFIAKTQKICRHGRSSHTQGVPSEQSQLQDKHENKQLAAAALPSNL